MLDTLNMPVFVSAIYVPLKLLDGFWEVGKSGSFDF